MKAVDGKRIAEEIQKTLAQKIKQSGKNVHLDVFVVGDDYATEKFITLKTKVAKSIGVNVRVHHFEDKVTTDELRKAILKSAEDKTVSGIIVQLALPSHINTRTILDTVPLAKDIDVLGTLSLETFREGTLDILPPVVGALKEVLEQGHVDVQGKRVVVIGKGSLVGAPSALWFKNNGADVAILDRDTENIGEITQKADVIVSGAGVPGLITKDMIKEGVVLLDAGTSESGGKLSGGADPACAEKTSIFTPVPGGIGPITIAILLRNLVSRSLQ
jgi:methylenetetrahydrofolate dehydrogenase (NADP+) / methenyltetrahydrofolate cyclohydrolase